MSHPNVILCFALLTISVGGCDRDYMTNAEALLALEEVNASQRGEAATTDPIEIGTHFTIGAALEAAADELADFWTSQVDCSTVTVVGRTVSVDYGSLSDGCTHNGHTYAGLTTVEVVNTTSGELEATHGWVGFQNEDVMVDGGALVTWSGQDLTRRVETEHTWTDLDDGTMVDVLGDHIFGYLDEGAGLLGGFTLEGTRSWSGESGDWDLDMADVEARLIDPVPQAGTFTVTDPEGRALEIAYERVDDTTIQATITGTRQPLVFHINALGGTELVD